MRNANWACFACREAVRRPEDHAEVIPCPRCGLACVCLGTRVPVPPKDDARAWRELGESLREARRADAGRREEARVRLRHRLERQALALEARPPDEARARALRLLRERLASL